MTTELTDEQDRRVDAFEAALAADPAADLSRHLPPSGHPHYLAVLAELVRVDMERGWSGGRPRRVADYRHRFPDALAEPAVLRQVAFEEFRQRRLAGDGVSPTDYAALYGLDTADWPSLASGTTNMSATRRSVLRAADLSLVATPAPARATALLADFRLPAGEPSSVVSGVPDIPLRLVPGGSGGSGGWPDLAPSFPEVGTEFLGFRLDDELGRGAFGRVYLARQGDLSDRSVALKVAYDIAGESRTLSQLQHANIVPIHSFHQAGRLQAVCMPYLGRTTLTQVVEAVSGRAYLPSSGRELKNTVNMGQASTVRSVRADRTPPVTAEPVARQAGRTADGWVALDGMSYVEAVLHLCEQLTAGLAHAHARGIVHRDLKPANVLLTDDGRAMLLDFNLAEDTKLRVTAEGARVGGTLPYMAPEQLDAFRANRGGVDGRCDMWALGVILFELLTGRHPFPFRRGPTEEVVEQMAADRRGGLRAVRPFNRSVSPAVEAVVRRCLAADPADRYQSADQLREDLQRQLAHRPLKYAGNPSRRERVRKWARRHPRLTCVLALMLAVGVVGSAAGGAAAAAREQARDDRARAVLADHRAAFADAQLRHDDRHQSLPRQGEALAQYRGLLARFGVPADGRGDDWLAADPVARLSAAERARLRADVGEAFYMLAQTACLLVRTADGPARAERLREAEGWHAAADRHAGDRLPRALLQQRADLAALAGDPAAADLAKAVEDARPGSPRDQVLLGTRHARAGQSLAADRHLKAATRLDPTNLSGWFVRGTVHLDLGQAEAAAECFSACVSLRPGFAPGWLNRAEAYSRLLFWDQAADDLDRALELDPGFTDARLLRASVREARGDLRGAADDLGRALDGGTAPSRAHFLRATVRDRMGDSAGAAADRAAGLSATPADEPSWIARALARLEAPPPAALARAGLAGGAFADAAVAAAALADVEAALRLNPESIPGLQLKAHVLGERLFDAKAALAVLDRAVALHPDHVPTRAGRAVEKARAGDRAAALSDAREALLRDTKAPNLYQVGCVYALTSRTHPDDRREALRLVRAALVAGFGMDLVDADPDLDPIRTDPTFQALVRDAKRLHATPPQ